MYSPCRDGLHVCGISSDEEEFVTVANVPGVTEALFERLKQTFGLPSGDDPDLVVDLCVQGDILADFGIRRQSLAALLVAAKA